MIGAAGFSQAPRPALFDVIAVNIATGAERFIDTGKDERNADAIVKFCVARLGVGEEIYITRPSTGAILKARP